MNRLALSSTALLLLVSCKGLPFFWRASSSDIGNADARARVEFQDLHYDGETLSGRILVSALDHGLRLDRRLIPSISLNTESISDCTTGKPLPFIVMDVLAPRPREEDLLVLEPGYWYGKEVRIPLFTESIQQQFHPDCINAEFTFRTIGGRAAARVRVRAERATTAAPTQPTP